MIVHTDFFFLSLLMRVRERAAMHASAQPMRRLLRRSVHAFLLPFCFVAAACMMLRAMPAT